MVGGGIKKQFVTFPEARFDGEFFLNQRHFLEVACSDQNAHFTHYSHLSVSVCNASNISILYLLLPNRFFRIHIKFGDAVIVGGDKYQLIGLVRVEDSVDTEGVLQAQSFHSLGFVYKTCEFDLLRASEDSDPSFGDKA